MKVEIRKWELTDAADLSAALSNKKILDNLRDGLPYPYTEPDGQWLKSIKFKLPIIEEDMEISLDNDTQVETVVLMSRIKGK